MLNRLLATILLLVGGLLLGGELLSAQTYSTPLPTVKDKDVALLRTGSAC